MKPLLIAALLIAAGILFVPAVSFVYESGGGAACARCHEMGTQFEKWNVSSHRNVNCTACHGDALTGDFQFHVTNARRVKDHLLGDVPAKPRLFLKDTLAMQQRCEKCHQQEAAAWASGPHSISYKQIFLDEKHNTNRQLMDDCLRCHGMHYDGAIRDLVTPISHKGPWSLKQPGLANKPVIPCTTCHGMHRKGTTLSSRYLEAKTAGARQEIVRPSIGLYDRRALEHVGVGLLPMPAMLDGERSVRMSPDRRQALCYQCHAALSTRQVNSGDDRTPIGVHEGLSCFACHDKHRQTTRASCSTCHPRLSNCGIDVEKMDTTFANTKSTHNIHYVKCSDCHPKGIPARKTAAKPRAL